MKAHIEGNINSIESISLVSKQYDIPISLTSQLHSSLTQTLSINNIDISKDFDLQSDLMLTQEEIKDLITDCFLLSSKTLPKSWDYELFQKEKGHLTKLNDLLDFMSWYYKNN
jgi:hypothetical protein